MRFQRVGLSRLTRMVGLVVLPRVSGVSAGGDHRLLDSARSDTTPDLFRDSSDDFELGRIYGKRLATGTGQLILPRR